MSNDVEHIAMELGAMRAVHAALQPLTRESRARVLRWVQQALPSGTTRSVPTSIGPVGVRAQGEPIIPVPTDPRCPDWDPISRVQCRLSSDGDHDWHVGAINENILVTWPNEGIAEVGS